jgi:hypothetical protein
MHLSKLARAGILIPGLALGLGCLILQSGCGYGQVDVTKPVYTSPEQLSKQTEEISGAMKGGAYGRAGMKAASKPTSLSK